MRMEAGVADEGPDQSDEVADAALRERGRGACTQQPAASWKDALTS